MTNIYFCMFPLSFPSLLLNVVREEYVRVDGERTVAVHAWIVKLPEMLMSRLG